MKSKIEVKKIETELNQEKVDCINYAYNEEITYWKETALARVLIKAKKKNWADLAPSRALLVCKEKIKKTVSIDETIFYLKSMYSRHNEEARTFINDIPTERPTI